MYQLAPNIELLFTEAGDYPNRVRAAAAAGFAAVEMWGPTGRDYPARPKDVPALKAALEETGTVLTAQASEPRTNFVIPPKDGSMFFAHLDEGVEIAHALGCTRIVVGSGAGFGGASRQSQLDELVGVFSRASDQIEGSGITLVLEAVNTRVDHPGSLLDRTAEAAYIARGVGSPFFGVLYDLYHSTVEGEDVASALADAGDLIRYVQIADAPGRGEPGSGSIEWAECLRELRASGYEGPIGLEYSPTTDSARSTDFIRRLVEGR
jgi:hydroxypyruvate isomerase